MVLINSLKKNLLALGETVYSVLPCYLHLDQILHGKYTIALALCSLLCKNALISAVRKRKFSIDIKCGKIPSQFFFGRERLRTHSIESSGKLKISPEQHWDFTAEDLKDLGEIGRGAYGSVNKMVHKPSGQIMAVKVGDARNYSCTSQLQGQHIVDNLISIHLALSSCLLSPAICIFCLVVQCY